MIGQTLSHYRIIKELGKGGIGVVYLAEDTLLGRQVAIKMLKDIGGLGREHYHKRFLREAQHASKLSHPHIATIHDFGETTDGRPYIVMEYVKGKTLSDLIQEHPLTLPQAVEIVIDVAEALSEAHRNGIVHRDIKPSNVAINERGEVKVLDFGLAKQVNGVAGEFSDPNEQALLNTQTREGVIIGTPMYLSPEQAMRASVDARSDLFSLGSVLYECITGTPAFPGVSPVDICAKVIRDEPLPPSRYNPQVPRGLDRITLRALAKKPAERYQSADELITDLCLPHVTRDQRLDSWIPSAPEKLKSLLTQIRENRRVILLFLAVLALIGLLITAYFSWIRHGTLNTSRQMEATRLAITGNVTEATISPDGKYVAAIIDEGGMQNLLLRQISTSSELQIVPPSRSKYKGLAFAPEGDNVYYLQEDKDTATLYRVSVLGGPSRKLVSNIDTPVTFSPNGNQLAFVRFYADKKATSLIIADKLGNEEKALATLTEPQFFSRGGFHASGPAWSPDGSVIAVPSFSVTDDSHRELVIVEVTNGRMKAITQQKWTIIEKLAWLANGSGLLMTAADQESRILQIWLVSYPNGEVRKITNDPNNYIGLSITGDSSILLSTKTERISSVWIQSAAPNVSAGQIASSRYIDAGGISWTTDGKLLYASNMTGNYNIWIMDSDGSNRKQLTFDERMNIEPVASPGGRYIVFVSFDARHPHLWRMDLDGANRMQLTSGGDEDLPRFTPDGKWIVYHSINQDNYNVRKIPIEGGEPVVLSRDYATQPDVSPDGKLVAFFAREENPNSSWSIVITSTNGGPSAKRFDLPKTVNPEWPGVRWTPDGQSLTYVATSEGVSNIWKQALAGGSPKPVTDFKEGQIFFFDWSPSVRKLAFVRGTDTKDLFLIRDFL